MKVLHISETIKGGVGTCLNVFDTAFDGEFEILYVVPKQHADHLTVAGRVITFDRPKRGIRAIRNLIGTALQVARQEKPQVLFFQSTYSLLAIAAFRALRVPGTYVYTPHGWSRLRYGHRPALQRIISFIEGRLSRLADVVINVSNNDRVLAQSAGYGGTHVVIENAMPDLPGSSKKAQPSLPEDKINLLFVGRFDRQKGLDLLLDAYARASAQSSGLHLHVIGAAVEDGNGSEMTNLPEAITFHGWVGPSDIAAYYSAVDLVVMPSRWESLPMVIIEALRMGTPVMLSRVCGMETLIEDGRSGLAVDLDAEALARALSDLDAEQLAQMRAPARALFEARYGLDRYRTEMQRLVDSFNASSP